MNLLIISSPTFSITPARLLKLQDEVPRLKLVYTSVTTVTQEQLSYAEIIIGCPPPEMLAEARGLRWHHTPNAGIEPYGNIRLYANREVILTNAKGVYGVPISEHTVGIMLALSRHFPYYVRKATEHKWKRRDDVRELFGSTVLIAGLGDLGLNIAQRLKSFDCKIIGLRKNILMKPAEVDVLYPLHRLADAVSGCDYAVSALPATAETVGVWNKAVFAAMGVGSVFINVGRGNAVVDDALIEVIKNGKLFGAGLDVASSEPLTPDSPYWELAEHENVLITAHSSAASPETYTRGFELVIDLLSRYEDGRRMFNVVDFVKGY